MSQLHSGQRAREAGTRVPVRLFLLDGGTNGAKW